MFVYLYFKLIIIKEKKKKFMPGKRVLKTK